MPNPTDEQFTSMMGSTQEYFIKMATINQLQMAYSFSSNFIYRYAQLFVLRLNVIATPKETASNFSAKPFGYPLRSAPALIELNCFNNSYCIPT
jgi:hypothetical protein